MGTAKAATAALFISLFGFGEAAAGGLALSPYVAGRVTLEISDANLFEFDKGVGGMVAGGVNIADRWRLEASVGRRSIEITKVAGIPADGNFSAWTQLISAYYHPLGRDRRFSPYVSVGGGYNFAKLEGFSTEPAPLAGLGYPRQRHISPSLEGKIGIATKATKKLHFDLAAVYFVSDDRDYATTFGNNITIEAAYRTYGLHFGARHDF